MRMKLLCDGPGWVVVDKPPGMLAHPTRPGGPVTLRDEVAGYFAPELASGGQVSIVNRLDRETSGAVLVALDVATARRLTIAMQRREISKEYLALVQGWPDWENREVDLPIGRRVTLEGAGLVWVEQIPHPAGTPARTTFHIQRRLLWQGRRVALVRAHPRTGRMHQIRVHLAHLGHPILGDKLYMTGTDAYLEFIRTGWTAALESRLWLQRQALHSASITFPNAEGCPITVQSPLPTDLAALLSQTETGADL